MNKQEIGIDSLDWIATSREFDQKVQIAAKVLAHLRSHQQRRLWSYEAGGQLFGRFDSNTMHVLEASGPYPKDSRSRYSYRSDPKSAQQAISVHNAMGLRYVGEWHTHPQQFPVPSSEDIASVKKVVCKSDIGVSALLLFVQGLASGSRGLSIFSSDGKDFFCWQLLDKPDHN